MRFATSFNVGSCSLHQRTFVNYIEKKFSKSDYFTIRNEYLTASERRAPAPRPGIQAPFGLWALVRAG